MLDLYIFLKIKRCGGREKERKLVNKLPHHSRKSKPPTAQLQEKEDSSVIIKSFNVSKALILAYY